jgi:hypothetical protein
MVGSCGLEPQTSPCQRPANQYFEQPTSRPRPPSYMEIRVRQSFNLTGALLLLNHLRGLSFLRALHADFAF